METAFGFGCVLKKMKVYSDEICFRVFYKCGFLMRGSRTLY